MDAVSKKNKGKLSQDQLYQKTQNSYKVEIYIIF